MLPDSAVQHYREQQKVTVELLAVASELWGSRPPQDFDRWFDSNIDMLMELLLAGQERVIAGSEAYVADTLDELGTPVIPEAETQPETLIGVASDGRALDSLMYGAVITAKSQVGEGKSKSQAWESGLHALMVRVQTQMADTSRAATSLSITTRPRVGYARMLNPPSCSRCAILAGRIYRWNAGFRRHPGCDCRGIPCREDTSSDLTTDLKAYFDSLPEPQQNKYFTNAGAEAIRAGADVSQVVNARRGMSTVEENAAGWIPKGQLSTRNVYGQQVETTTEGVTRRGQAYDAMSNAGYAQRSTDTRGRRYFEAKAPRLMPESIMSLAEDRADALRLLKLYGYLR